MTAPPVSELAQQIRGGSVRALARGLSWVESGGEHAERLTEELYPYSGRAQLVGITGAPGTGKSTLAGALTLCARTRGLTVGIVAIDPSSPFSGGSILGDRIRMTEIGGDPGVFIRSMATRGALGGLCHAARDAVDLMDAAGKDLIIIETVGVGQDEVDIMQLAQTTVVVSVPGLGDEIQALKAGVLEIADIHAVNKADREGAKRAVAELRAALALSAAPPAGWTPPILACVATRGTGVDELLEEVGKHQSHLKASGELQRRERRIAESRVLKLTHHMMERTLRHPVEDHAESTARDVDRVARRELSPARCARALLARIAEKRPAHV